jgi:hypothetical protein
MRIKDLERLTGGLTQTSKMPGFSYGISAKKCKLGALLVNKPGSVCSGCYALKGAYRWRHVHKAQARRLVSIKKAGWVGWMSELIEKKLRNKEKIFRWHDSGDLQGIQHLDKIVEIAKRLPDVCFWLPTREGKMIRDWIKKGNSFPSNLIVRLSATMIGQTSKNKIPGTLHSTVSSGTGFLCPARTQGNICGDCRACWDKSVLSVDYVEH